MSLGFEDCKVYISNVDSQSSAEGGIIVQVIGEMSNSGRPWRKFAQTFFLAEQPNGFFVLNDIFRNIKEEGDDEDEHQAPAAQPATASAHDVVPAAAAPVADADEPTREVAQASAAELEPLAIADPTPAESTAFPSFIPIDDAVASPLTNGVHHEPAAASPSSASPAPPTTNDETAAEPVKDVEPEPTPAVVEPVAPAPVAPVVAEVAPTAVAPTSIAAPVAPVVEESTPAPAATESPAAPIPSPSPAPASAPTPKTWASLAASNKTKWGTQAVGVSGVSSAAPPPTAAAAPAQAGASASARAAPADTPARTYAPVVMAVTHASCFVKGVLETVSESNLRAHLESKFGALRELDIIRSVRLSQPEPWSLSTDLTMLHLQKACAFLEFERLDSARRAIQASLRPSEGGEGGIFVESDAGGDMIHIVSKKPLGDRPVSTGRGRGGGLGGDDRRGGYTSGRGTGASPGYKGDKGPNPPSDGSTRGGAKSGGRGRGAANGTTGSSTRGASAPK